MTESFVEIFCSEVMDFDPILEEGHVRNVCLTGGSTASVLYSENIVKKTLKKYFFEYYFTDERCVSTNHADSNYKMVFDTIFGSCNAEKYSIYRIETEKFSIQKQTSDYAQILPKSFDVLILSVGEDGHIASLFPGSSLLDETVKKAAYVLRSPKPPSKRITITSAVIKSAKKVILLATGAKKGYILSEALRKPNDVNELPVRLAIGGTWLLDKSAAASFQKNKPKNFHKTRVIYA